MTTRTTARLRVDGAELDYDVAGQGPAVIQAHGLMSSRAREGRIGFDFGDLVGADRRLVRYDARGHGESTGRTVPDDYLWPALANDLLTLRSAVAGDDPVDAIGASMGAATILHAALRAPAAFGRLVLVIPPTAWQTRAAQAETYAAGAEAIEQHGLDLYVAAARTQLLPPVISGVDGFEFDPQVSEALLPTVLRGAGRSDLPSPEALAAVRQPTLLLPWAGDPGHPQSTTNRLAEVLPNATLNPAAASPADVRRWGPLAVEFLTG